MLYEREESHTEQSRFFFLIGIFLFLRCRGERRKREDGFFFFLSSLSQSAIPQHLPKSSPAHYKCSFSLCNLNHELKVSWVSYFHVRSNLDNKSGSREDSDHSAKPSKVVENSFARMFRDWCTKQQRSSQEA
ncbi:PREDICTED: uncharacterized protein LOC101306785 [Fragaria vesca subsp. vesca]|uniref:uncharacterized protein LOC101306785 n=1 Tax=Fragaria vesca subsp. vesca TaxID=101020 RepID=UPI0002C32421|nr:PREDICTED: uncharacterized protein LOC101306785 [Fragaria vesca subsp. vesca]